MLGKRGYAACGWSTRPRRSAASPAGCRGCPGTPSGDGCATGGWASSTGSRTSGPDRARPRRRGVQAAGADIVIVATGAHWATDGLNAETRGPLPGADASLPHILTPEQILLDGKRPPGSRVVIYDCDGYFTAPGIAELLRLEGHDVAIATPAARVAEYSDETLEGDLLRQHLHDLGIAMLAERVVHAVHPGGVRGQTTYGDAFALPADAVVLVTQRRSNDGLWREFARPRPAGALPDRRLRRAPPDRGRDLRRPPPRPRARHARSRDAAAAPARAALGRAARVRAAARRLRASPAVPPRGGVLPASLPIPAKWREAGSMAPLAAERGGRQGIEVAVELVGAPPPSPVATSRRSS